MIARKPSFQILTESQIQKDKEQPDNESRRVIQTRPRPNKQVVERKSIGGGSRLKEALEMA